MWSKKMLDVSANVSGSLCGFFFVASLFLFMISISTMMQPNNENDRCDLYFETPSDLSHDTAPKTSHFYSLPTRMRSWLILDRSLSFNFLGRTQQVLVFFRRSHSDLSSRDPLVLRSGIGLALKTHTQDQYLFSTRDPCPTTRA
ncbi:unnamed protein product [Amoebophrya sp. A25]|nr:unnamed protein product [Amoebophrya sp. A25]CAD7945207.1 unnamed protein product [Amoebophrya sp. A25]|eukprot:GSA25T00008056001.1